MILKTIKNISIFFSAMILSTIIATNAFAVNLTMLCYNNSNDP